MDMARGAEWMLAPLDWNTSQLGSQVRHPDAQSIQAVAGQFEALLVGQLLRSMREAGGSGWLGCGDDEAGAGLMELAEQHLASAIAASGGLGLAALVEKGLQAAAAGASPPTATSSE